MDALEVKSMITGVLTASPLRCTIQQLCNDFVKLVGCEIPFRKFGFTNIEDYLLSIPDTVQVLGNGPYAQVRGVIKPKSAHINIMVAKQRTNKVPDHKRKYLKKRNSGSPQPRIASPLQSSSFEDGYRSRVPPGVQNNLRKLILRFPDGIRCSKLPNEYQRMCNQQLQFDKYHYRSLIEMCSDLREIFYFTQIDNDFMLYDKNAIIPSLGQNEASLKESLERNIDATEATTINWSLGPELIPPNVTPLSEVIPHYFPDRTAVGEYLDIAIGEIYDINNFWIYLPDGQLKPMMKELQQVFHTQQNHYVIPEILLEVGLYCTVFYSNEYHRGVIVDLLDNTPNCVQVLFIDYGSVGNIKCDQIWYLPKEFSKVPSQAIKATLYKIKPQLDTIQTTKKFIQLITAKTSIAEIMLVDKKFFLDICRICWTVVI